MTSLEKQSALPQENVTIKTRRRLFISLITSTCSLVVVTLVLLWVVPYIGLQNLHPAAPLLLGTIFLLLGLAVIWAWLGLVLNIYLGRSILFSTRLRGVTIKLFLPLMTLLARFVGISKEQVSNSFIKVNNELIKNEHRRYPADKILLLIPHCLQNSQCNTRLTHNIRHCKRCGKCPITDILSLSEEFGVHLAIATGGTIARRIVVKIRPQLIIAVACERDLSSGTQDTYPIPVYGICNERPRGPCLDTLVAATQLREALKLFLNNSS